MYCKVTRLISPAYGEFIDIPIKHMEKDIILLFKKITSFFEELKQENVYR